MKILIGIIFSYVMGSIPFAYIITKLKTSLDIREIGSKNMGSGNVFHSVGIKEGLLVLFLDIEKGCLSTIFSYYILKLPPHLVLLVSFFAVIGHICPIFLKFKGGRGAATTLGIQITFLFSYLKELGFFVFLPILLIYLLLIITTRSQVISLFFLFPFYPVLLYAVSRDVKIFLVNLFFVIALLLSGLPSFKREFKKLKEGKR